MKNTKKIGGFKTPLFKALSRDELRQNLQYAKVINGYVYASDAHILIKQSLQDFHLITPEECKLIEGKTFHFDLLKQLWAFEHVRFEEHRIVAYKGSAKSEFEYSPQIDTPNFEAILKYSFEDTRSIRLNASYLKIILSVMDFEISPLFIFNNTNCAVTICNSIDELHVQHGVIMPISQP